MKKKKKCSLAPQERRRHVQARRARGQSKRQIALTLGCDESTVRLDIDILALPARHRLQIDRGESVTAVFARHKQDQAIELNRRRTATKDAIELHARALAKLIIEWLEMFGLFSKYLEPVIRQVDWNSFHANTNPATARDYSEAAAVIKAATPGPHPTELFELIDWLIKVLTRWLTRLEPSREIRDSALKTVARHFDCVLA